MNKNTRDDLIAFIEALNALMAEVAWHDEREPLRQAAIKLKAQLLADETII